MTDRSSSEGSPRKIESFSLPASTGQTLGLDSFRGKVPLVLLFLDLDREDDRSLLADLNLHHKDFGSERTQVLAVLRVTAREARQIADDMGLSVPLLADASGTMARDYDVEDNGQRRVALVADKDGYLVRRFDPLPVDEPSDVTEALLFAVRAIGTGAVDRVAEN